jgi:hypothetical protein
MSMNVSYKGYLLRVSHKATPSSCWQNVWTSILNLPCTKFRLFALFGMCMFTLNCFHSCPFLLLSRQLRLEVLHNEYQGTVVRHFDRLARVLQDRIPHFWKRLNDRLSMFRFADTRLTFPKLISIEGWCRFLSGHQKLHFVLASDVVLLPLIRGLSPLQPHWRCWLLQVRYIRILSKRYLAHSKLGLLHSLITECVRQCVELYSDDMLTSKAHHSTHWDLEIVDAGTIIRIVRSPVQLLFFS